ncbi:BRE1-domain-containing protein [Myriangium duriaei CBS 260.36]|uniref:E3 ubiquitin protein ligase n=1 Tax=Myriangium duriaei CBS 260.36 TaxID=1168546 RepID=A0A9P4JFP6_9PEZI|nr:BRE1-domain-containing protein [Myriangium duriaei CBS 260.36]
MKVPTLEQGAFPSLHTTIMDDRKRGIAADTDDGGPPSKRQATAANGAAMRMGDLDKEKDVENFQKGAIFRQMKEYQRERNDLQSQVKDLTRRATYHDDHIRLIDAWFSQLLDEISVLIQGAPVADKSSESFSSSLLGENSNTFEEHLGSRSKKIKDVIQNIYSRIPQASPEVNALQERMSALLAAEKAHIVELQRVVSEKEQLSERLENASYRYLVAEKKLDRAKSAAVQKLEQQAVLKRDDDTTKVKDEKSKSDKVETNGEVDAAAHAAIDSARREAVAVSEKRRLQVEQLEVENKKLTDELTAARSKAASATDDDYAVTGLFRTTKSQMDDMIRRINDLKATNTQLREEAQRLQAERTNYRAQVEEESRATIAENESSHHRNESDLIRIRNIRDELTAEIAILKGAQGNTSQSSDAVRELAEAREERIKALESEVERYKLQLGESKAASTTDLDDVGVEELKTRFRSLESQHSLLSIEMPSMEAAWRKSQALASKKVADVSAWEEQISRLGAEKAKADQKYFATMKSKETTEASLRALKAQSAKATEIVSSLKEAEQQSRLLAAGLEKQVAEAKDGLNRLEIQNRALQQKLNEGEISSQTAKTEISELRKLVTSKDETATKTGNEKRKIEVELSECKTRLDDAKKQVELLKKRTAKGDAAEADDWRKLAICPVCNNNLRNTALKFCGHCFCSGCVQDLISNRSRKCPSCGKAFGANDSTPITLA